MFTLSQAVGRAKVSFQAASRSCLVEMCHILRVRMRLPQTFSPSYKSKPCRKVQPQLRHISTYFCWKEFDIICHPLGLYAIISHKQSYTMRLARTPNSALPYSALPHSALTTQLTHRCLVRSLPNQLGHVPCLSTSLSRMILLSSADVLLSVSTSCSRRISPIVLDAFRYLRLRRIFPVMSDFFWSLSTSRSPRIFPIAHNVFRSLSIWCLRRIFPIVPDVLRRWSSNWISPIFRIGSTRRMC